MLLYGIITTKVGGNTPVVEISAKTRKNIEKLETELSNLMKTMKLEEDINVPAQAFIIESKAAKNANYINPNASMIIRKGIIREGEAFICGDSYGKVRQIVDDHGNQIKEAFPGVAVEMAGFKTVPISGSVLSVLNDIKIAEKLIEDKKRLKEYNEAQSKENIGKGFKVGKLHRKERHLLMRKGDKEALKRKIESVLAAGTNQNVDEAKLREIYFLEGANKKKIILRSDTIGMLESIEDELLRLFDEKLLTDLVIDSSVAPLTEDDFKFAQSSNSIFFVFNNDQDLDGLSDAYKVGVRKHKLIYNIVEEIQYFIQESQLLDPSPENELIKGRGFVKDVFKIKINNKHTQIAGTIVESGNLYPNNKYRIIRKNLVHKLNLKVSSLKQNKVSMNIVKEEEECGIIFDDYEDLLAGDYIDCYSTNQKFEGITNTKHVVCSF